MGLFGKKKFRFITERDLMAAESWFSLVKEAEQTIALLKQAAARTRRGKRPRTS